MLRVHLWWFFDLNMIKDDNNNKIYEVEQFVPHYTVYPIFILNLEVDTAHRAGFYWCVRGKNEKVVIVLLI